MVCIEFNVNAQGKYTGFKVEGHSGYATAGSDIVCAAISTLAQTITIGITDVIKLKAKVEQDQTIPLLKLTLEEVTSESEILLQTMARAIEQITLEYPEFAKLG